MMVMMDRIQQELSEAGIVKIGAIVNTIRFTLSCRQS